MRIIVLALVIAACFHGQSVGAQSSPPFSEHVPEHLHLSRYVNQTLAFELSYPSSYKLSQSPVSCLPSHEEQCEVLLYATTGSGQARCEDQGECDKFGRMTVALDRRSFDLPTIERYYAHTGWDQPVSFRVDGHTFYWYGAGGGGVVYPDTFLCDLNGSILVIEFDGPYPPGSKSPSEETEGIEKIVLQSFRRRGKPRPGN